MVKIVSLLLCLLSIFLAAPLRAEPIKLMRGLPTDVWITWPDGERFSEPGLVATFPEYRQVFRGNEFKLAKDAGFDFIRLAIDPSIFLWQPGPDRTEKLLKGVKAAIDDIRAHDLKVVVDLHSIPRTGGGMGTEQILANDTAYAAFLRVVADVAALVATYPPAEVAFEPLNEPTIDCRWDRPHGLRPHRHRWPSLLKRLHATARAAAPETTLVLSGACWGGAAGLVQLNPSQFKDQNILWSFHSYEPFLFTHQGASWTGGHYQFVEGLTFPPKVGDKKRLLKMAQVRLDKSDARLPDKIKWRNALKRDFKDYFRPNFALRSATASFALVERWARKHGVAAERIMMGEFGAIRGDLSRPLTDQERVGFITLVRQEAEKRGYAWSIWSWTGSFGISEKPDGKIFSPVILQALGMK